VIDAALAGKPDEISLLADSDRPPIGYGRLRI
jgi:hypothetical protein